MKWVVKSDKVKLSKEAKNDIGNLIVILFVVLFLFSPLILAIVAVWLDSRFENVNYK